MTTIYQLLDSPFDSWAGVGEGSILTTFGTPALVSIHEKKLFLLTGEFHQDLVKNGHFGK